MCCMFSSYMSQFDLEYGVAGEPMEQWRICGGVSDWLESGMMKGILSSDLAAGPFACPGFPQRNSTLSLVIMASLSQYSPGWLLGAHAPSSTMASTLSCFHCVLITPKGGVAT